jgi:hypothetical protein
MLVGSTAAHFLWVQDAEKDKDSDEMEIDDEYEEDEDENQMKREENGLTDAGPDDGPKSLSSICLASKPGTFFIFLACSHSTRLLFFQYVDIQRISRCCRNISSSPAFPMHSSHSCTLPTTPTVLFPKTLKCVSVLLTRFTFFTQLSPASILQVTYAAHLECTGNASDPLHHGMVTPGVIQSLL